MINFDYSKIKNPVFSLEKIHARDPAVLVTNNLIYLFLTYFDPEKITWHIGMTTTEDFLHFSGISIISPEGYASPGNVIKVKDEWVICYQQYREFPHYICLSRSKDLINWSKPYKIFNTSSENKWNIDKRVIDPYIVEWEGIYYLFYTGSTRWGKKSGHNLIGVACSKDLENWQDISLDRPVIGVYYPWEEPDGNENNCVIRYKDKWFMLYSASLTNQKIAYAVSDDLVNWEKKGLCNVPIFKSSVRRFGAPFIIEGLREGKYYMIYQGEAEDGHMSFLLLESDDLINWK